ncbi:hypothetical protein K6U06_04620 [Acidiferrimicrobium sp. IK]|uniref:hypothetical protein n=1 Tax=Acidiferrimicrobium sp. IK TaxID=2871700 RepID=UPI0021CB6504|nr:hypothetical protein [Acidiferrimicrobium sp. IK]MCU4183632.1 hypothetical protein [Acidiferrimicrobium sp. IK]
MVLLVIKVLVAPLLVASGSAAQRRWGPAVGGRIIGLPLTAVPLLVLLAVVDGPHFAAGAATADQAGGVAQAGWCLAYALAARRLRPMASFGVASSVFAVLAVAAGLVAIPIVPATALSAGAVLLALAVWPDASGTPEVARPWRLELPARMVVAAAFTFVIAESAGALGARPAGLVGAFPLLTAILAVATHLGTGPVATERFLQGVLGASGSVVAGVGVLAVALPRAPLALAVAASVLAALAAQSVLSPRAARHLESLRRAARRTFLARHLPFKHLPIDHRPLCSPRPLAQEPDQPASCTTLASRRPAALRVRSTS